MLSLKTQTEKSGKITRSVAMQLITNILEKRRLVTPPVTTIWLPTSHLYSSLILLTRLKFLI